MGKFSSKKGTQACSNSLAGNKSYNIEITASIINPFAGRLFYYERDPTGELFLEKCNFFEIIFVLFFVTTTLFAYNQFITQV